MESVSVSESDSAGMNDPLELRACLHQVSESMLRQLCHDTSDTVFIENNGVASEYGWCKRALI